MENRCPKCNTDKVVKSGIVNNKQRFLCKDCNYFSCDDQFMDQEIQYYKTSAF